MDTIHDVAAQAAELPRFDDGKVNVAELIRLAAQALVNEIMDAQADEACADGNQRNGYRERRLTTSVGEIALRIPELRQGSYFPEDLLVRYSRVDRAVVAAVSEMVANGVSTRKVERLADLAAFADRLEKATLDAIEAGQMTGDLARITMLEGAAKLSTADFIAAVGSRLSQTAEDTLHSKAARI